MLAMASKTENKKELEELRNAEKKYQTYIERRNELNNLARILKEERDMINKKHKELKEAMERARKERDELVSKMRYHKKLRNDLQKQAKELIEARRKRKGEVFKYLPLRVEELKADVQMLEYQQETMVLTPAEENELIEKIREKKAEYENALIQLEKQKTIEIDLSDKEKAISELFKKADEEHQKVQQYYSESQKKHEEYIKLVQELAVNIAESNKKHQQYLEVRNEAQKNHEKAMEMRSKIISFRDERRKRWIDAKKVIEEQNLKARKAVLDEEKLQELAEEALNALKRGHKITL